MSKELEALRFATRDFSSGRDENGNYFTKKDFDLDIIEKELKALEIIKNKKVNVEALFYSTSCEDYNKHYTHYEDLTQEEYDLLKEVLL